MDPLESLLRPVARVLNRNIRETARARELCAELEGTTAAIRVANTGLTMAFTIEADRVLLGRTPADDPDFVLTGSPLTLARVVAGADQEALRDGSLDLTGNPYKAQAFQKLLASARPDIEEELSVFLGDSAAHGIGEMARGFARWFADARSTMSGNVREYLQEESRELPTRYEYERFVDRVDTLRDDVERCAARVERLVRRRTE